ncbi:multiple sugar transport system ATP-binding protein [Limimaricola variabilis]|uniref:Multiple sugar transport system ATP-binding protein n=1 Tax=Limimaricola variabilis TaxID=1492771 RepID=A0ABR6HJ84_9RHOB|nr:ABC transporter ATP-binding protein [Limimaricola variabilis]MBB3710486.1 multiple sugar transport system ATP-binding protein [Limimaricola variabilis]
MARIELRNVVKRYGSFTGVRRMDLDIADEEFLVLLGPSGCGKTTTMRMIAGLEEPSEGEVVIGGEVVNEVDARDRDVAMVFQGYALYPNMSIYENIRFPLRMRGIGKSDQDALIRRAAEMVELGDFLDRKPGALSGGQRQRAALARAVVRQPQVFLMDEPLSNLDAKLRSSMRVQIKHLQRQLRITTVYVTHDQIEAMTLADRIVIMEKGVIRQIGTPDEIYSDPADTFVAGFIGAPPMNLVEGKAENGRFTAPGLVAACPPDISGRITLGVRPEDCRVVTDGPAELAGAVYGVEPTGETTYLTLRTGETLFEVKAARDARFDLGAPVKICFDPERIYFFDTETGVRLRAQPQRSAA